MSSYSRERAMTDYHKGNDYTYEEAMEVVDYILTIFREDDDLSFVITFEDKKEGEEWGIISDTKPKILLQKYENHLPTTGGQIDIIRIKSLFALKCKEGGRITIFFPKWEAIKRIKPARKSPE